MMDRAVEAARKADVALVFLGSNPDWESEGRDRKSMQLPGDQEELVTRVAAVNANTERAVAAVNAHATSENRGVAAAPPRKRTRLSGPFFLEDSDDSD